VRGLVGGRDDGNAYGGISEAWGGQRRAHNGEGPTTVLGADGSK
jgi:hypothetical protein